MSDEVQPQSSAKEESFSLRHLPPLPSRRPDVHKGACGRVLVIAGSAGMTGAGVLASRAALRAGAGLVTWAIPSSLHLIAEVQTVEVITLPIPETEGHAPGVDAREHLLEAAREVQAVILGPGLPVAGETGELIRLLVPEISAPLLLDAGALAAIGKEYRTIQKRKAPTVVTPHPGEMSYLTGLTVEEIQRDRTGIAVRYAQASGAIVVLKGAGTVISDGKRTEINPTGNPGMATAGSGDVLAGVIAGLLAQGMSPWDAARLGVYLHGLAGDLAREEKGEHGLIASDILEALPRAYLTYANARRRA